MSDTIRKQSKAHMERYKHPETPMFNKTVDQQGWVPEGLKPSDKPIKKPRQRRSLPTVSKALVHVPRDEA